MFGLMPKENVFFDLLEKAAVNAHDGALKLLELLENYTDVAAKVEQIKKLEHAGDELTRETLDRLAKTFITPMDREDIQHAAQKLDDVIDQMNSAAHRMLLYKVARATDEARAFGKVLVRATDLLVKAFAELRHLKKKGGVILGFCAEIRTEEHEGDVLRQRALANLFENEPDAKEIIKWKDIYQILEKATDRCEDVSDVIHQIVVKNA